MSEYYAELAASADPARVDGWRHQLEQWLRFQGVIQGLGIDDGASVVDLGCGTGQLCGYLGGRRGRSYLGVDRLATSIERARAAFPEAEFICADLGDAGVEGRRCFDFAVAIGSMVDGQALRREQRIAHLRQVVGRLVQLSRKGWALVVLNQKRLEADPIGQLEVGLQGASTEELQEVLARHELSGVVDDQLLPTDLFAMVRYDEDRRHIRERIAGDGAHEAVLARYAAEAGGAFDEADAAWLWMVSGRYERAQRIVADLPPSHRRKSLLAKRLQYLAR